MLTGFGRVAFQIIIHVFKMITKNYVKYFVSLSAFINLVCVAATRDLVRNLFCKLKVQTLESSILNNKNIKIGKAGRKRWLGFRPKVRGVAMNPIDHPHGGGEGRTSGGRHPSTPWGKPTKGYKTRKNKKTDRTIIRSRRNK